MGYFDRLNCPHCKTVVPPRDWVKFKDEKLASCRSCEQTLWMTDTAGGWFGVVFGTLPGAAAGMVGMVFFLLMDKSSPIQWAIFISLIVMGVAIFLLFAILQLPLTNVYRGWYEVCRHCGWKYQHTGKEPCPKCKKTPTCPKCKADLRDLAGDNCAGCGLLLKVGQPTQP